MVISINDHVNVPTICGTTSVDTIRNPTGSVIDTVADLVTFILNLYDVDVAI